MRFEITCAGPDHLDELDAEKAANEIVKVLQAHRKEAVFWFWIQACLLPDVTDGAGHPLIVDAEGRPVT